MFSWFEKRVDPFPNNKVAVLPKQFLKFTWKASEGVRLYILLIGVLSAVLGVFEAFLLAALGKVVDWISAVEPLLMWEQVGGRLILIVCLVIASIVLVAVHSLIKWQIFSNNLPMRLRWNFHRLMLGQSMSFFQNEFAGTVSTKIMQTAQALRQVYIITIDIFVYAIIYFVTISVSIGNFNKLLLLPFGGWLLGYLAVLKWFVPRQAKGGRILANSRSMLVGRLTDSYTNISTVKLFSHGGREASYAKEAMTELLGDNRWLLRGVCSFEILNYILSMLLLVGSVGIALRLWVSGAAGIGAVVAAGAMALRLSGISDWIMWESTQLFEQVGVIQDGINILSRRQEIKDAPDAVKLKVTKGDIRFENVSFSYDNENPNAVIDGFSLHIKPGEKIGLVGRSGAGKSTIVNLLLRFHDIDGGRILIDGQDISRATQDSLRANIGIVMQDTSLLHRSVRDNILYGRPEATEEEMRSAAVRAEADDFIMQLMDYRGRGGYDAHVGERGVKLSGGQRQRIAIARVMLKDAPILLLDEATSALDSEVEVVIQENLYRLMEGKTVVAIAHRLSTIAAMDRLVVVDKGRIVEEGDHKSLLGLNGVYARLWARQSGGFLGDIE